MTSCCTRPVLVSVCTGTTLPRRPPTDTGRRGRARSAARTAATGSREKTAKPFRLPRRRGGVGWRRHESALAGRERRGDGLPDSSRWSAPRVLPRRAL